MPQRPREILSSLNPRLLDSISEALDDVARAIGQLDAVLPPVTRHVEIIRHHLAFEIEKATLVIDRVEWDGRGDLDAARQRLDRLNGLLDTLTVERATASRDFLDSLFDSLRALRDQDTSSHSEP
ncbi:hypothetical protein [uncultured Methylobacterium sp.]|jgi:hypothetical protein|uniref:hypothetical protein n=1 Tax=uncultured Methylobacterium sp. TaxID=157278 RepID=UPI002622E776|nr:hypothetical protein [uncultured Methylobacterium sp.]